MVNTLSNNILLSLFHCIHEHGFVAVLSEAHELLGSQSLELELDLRAVVVPLHGRLGQPLRKVCTVGAVDTRRVAHAVPTAISAFLHVAVRWGVRHRPMVWTVLNVREEDVDPTAEPCPCACAHH